MSFKKIIKKKIESLKKDKSIDNIKSNRLFEEIEKLSRTAVQPLYYGTDSSVKEFEFTPADIASGKIKGKDIKKWKGRSLATRVMSKDFGKVKTKAKKKK